MLRVYGLYAMAERNTTRTAEHTAKAIDQLADTHARFTEAGQIMVDSIEANWEVRMILAENGFTRQTELTHGGFEVFAQ